MAMIQYAKFNIENPIDGAFPIHDQSDMIHTQEAHSDWFTQQLVMKCSWHFSDELYIFTLMFENEAYVRWVIQDTPHPSSSKKPKPKPKP